MGRTKDYLNIYQQHLKFEIPKLEQERIKAYKQTIKECSFCHIIPILIIILSHIAIHIIFKNYIITLPLLVPTILLITCFLYFLNTKIIISNANFTSSIKDKLLPALLSSFSNIEWHPNKTESGQYHHTGLNLSAITPEEGAKQSSIIYFPEFINSNLFMKCHKENHEDEFSGEYNNVSFKISEIRLIGVERVFQGGIILLKHNNPINNHIIISTKNALLAKHTPLLTILTSMTSILLIFNDGIITSHKIIAAIISTILIIGMAIFKIIMNNIHEKVDMSNSKFKHHFNIYATNPQEAQNIINTNILQTLYNIQKIYNVNELKCAFYKGNKVMISLSTKKNLFEICSLYKSLYDSKLTIKFFEQLNSIYRLIDSIAQITNKD